MIVTVLALVACPIQSALQHASESTPTSSIPQFDASPDGHRSRVIYDAMPDGTIWARGRAYKVSVDTSRLTFIPFLGSDAPRNYPVRMRLASMRRGADAFALAVPAGAERSADRVSIDHGTVRVRYDLTAEGAAQSFSVDAAPGSGDLVLSIEVETELHASAENSGFRFSNELGGVTYGAATVFDAAGHQAAVEAEWSNGQIDLTVPSSFLDEAEWPILVDPLLTPFQIVSSTAELLAPDAAFDSAGRYSVVAEERFSAADSDVLTWYLDTSGNAFGATYIDQTTDSWEAPRVSVKLSDGTATNVLAEGPSSTVAGATDIVWRVRRYDMSLRPPQVAWHATSSYSCAAPDLGADALGLTAVGVYNRVYPGHRDVHSLLLGNFSSVSERPVAVSPMVDYGAPRISSTSGFTPLSLYFVVGWAARDVATGASSVQTARVMYNGSSSEGPFTIAGPSTTAFYFDVEVSPELLSINGVNDPYIVTYDDRPSSETDAFVAICRGGNVQGTYELQLSEHASRTPNQNDVRIIASSNRLMLGYEENGSLYMTTVQPIDGELGLVERRLVASTPNMAPGSLAAADAVFDSTVNWDGIFLWATEGLATGNIRGALARHPNALAPAAGVQYCYGTPNSTGDRGFIQASGNQSLVQPKTLRVEALPPDVFGYYLASTDTGLVPNAGGSQGTLCVGGSLGRFGIFQANGEGMTSLLIDPTMIPQPSGFVSAMAGERWNFQVWYRDAVMGAATSNFTNAVTIPF